MQVELPIVNSQRCAAKYLSVPDPLKIDSKIQICAGHKKGEQDACQVFQNSQF